VVDLVNGNSGVDDSLLNDLLLDDRLNSLVDVDVLVFCDKLRLDDMGVLDLGLRAGVAELSLLLGETSLYALLVVVVELAVLDSRLLVLVALRQDFLVLDRLDGGVVDVLVLVLVDNSLYVFLLLALDVLVHNGGGHVLVDTAVGDRCLPGDDFGGYNWGDCCNRYNVGFAVSLTVALVVTLAVAFTAFVVVGVGAVAAVGVVSN